MESGIWVPWKWLHSVLSIYRKSAGVEKWQQRFSFFFNEERNLVISAWVNSRVCKEGFSCTLAAVFYSHVCVKDIGQRKNSKILNFLCEKAHSRVLFQAS